MRRVATKVDILNEAQFKILEGEYRISRNLGELRVPVQRSACASVLVSKVGPPVTSQFVGRWFANRVKDDVGLPRLQRKTPEQLAVLEESFTTNPYPDAKELTRIVRLTLLSKKQVTAWFCNERKKNPAIIEARRRHEEAILAQLPPDFKEKGPNTHAIEKYWIQVEKERRMGLERMRLQTQQNAPIVGQAQE